MGIKVETKDCTALSDAELAEMAEIAVEGSAGFGEELLSKAREEWVLITSAHRGSSLVGFSFCTLERIGGTPSVLIGLASVARADGREKVVEALLTEALRRSVLAFPDEDVLVATRLLEPSGYVIYDGLTEVVPRPGHKATGEERAWARRLAKRFGCEGKVDDRTFRLEGTGAVDGVLDYTAVDGANQDEAIEGYFDGMDAGRGDCLVVFGWAMAEELAPLASL